MRMFTRNGMWHADVRVGKQRKRISTEVPAIKPKHEAEKVAQEKLRLIFERQQVKQGGHVLTLGFVLRRHLEEHWSKMASSITTTPVVHRICREVGHWLIHEITYKVLWDYAQALIKDGLAPATVNRRLTCIGTALRHCVRIEELASMPQIPRFAEDNQKDRYMTEEEERLAFGYVERMTRDDTAEKRPEWAYLLALVEFLVDTGARLGEALRVKPENVTWGEPSTVMFKGIEHHMGEGWAGKTKRARGKKTTKTGKSRTIPLTARAEGALKRMLAHPLHGNVTQDWVGHRWGKVRKEIEGMEDVNIHILRHTCASRLVQRGVGIYEVMQWLGHANINTTLRYAHLAPDMHMRSLAALERRPMLAVDNTQETRDAEHLTTGTVARHTIIPRAQRI